MVCDLKSSWAKLCSQMVNFPGDCMLVLIETPAIYETINLLCHRCGVETFCLSIGQWFEACKKKGRGGEGRGDDKIR